MCVIGKEPNNRSENARAGIKNPVQTKTDVDHGKHFHGAIFHIVGCTNNLWWRRSLVAGMKRALLKNSELHLRLCCSMDPILASIFAVCSNKRITESCQSFFLLFSWLFCSFSSNLCYVDQATWWKNTSIQTLHIFNCYWTESTLGKGSFRDKSSTLKFCWCYSIVWNCTSC